MKKIIKLTESQLKKITEMVILEQGAMDDILNNSPNAPTYGAGTPTADSPKPKYGAPPADTTRQKTLNNAFCSSVGGMISFQVPGMKNISYSVDQYVKMFNVTPEELKAAKDSCPNSELSKKMVKQDPNVNCASSLDEIKEGSIKILKYGCKTDAVKELQKLLGMEEKYQTGYFGPITKGKVTEFQKSNGLKVDGIVGIKTYGALTTQSTTPENTNDTTQTTPEPTTQPEQTNEYSNRLNDLDEDEDIAMLDNLLKKD